MSLLWMEGFDNQDLSRWALQSGGAVAFVAGRVGGFGAELNNINDVITRPISPVALTLSYGCAVKIVSNSGNSVRILLKDVAGSNGTYCTITGSDTAGWSIDHLIGTTTRSSSLGQPQRLGVWEHIEVSYVQHATAGSISVRFNGITVYQYSGRTDTNSGAAPIAFLTLAATQSSINLVVDDVWVATGESYGDCRVRGLVPTADVTKGWTPSTGTDHYALVDEAPPSMTDYVSAVGGTGAVDTFTVTVPGDLTSVSAVGVTAHGLKTDVGSTPLRLLADGQESADIGMAVGAATTKDAVYATASGSAAWTPAKLAAAPFGIKAV